MCAASSARRVNLVSICPVLVTTTYTHRLTLQNSLASRNILSVCTKVLYIVTFTIGGFSHHFNNFSLMIQIESIIYIRITEMPMFPVSKRNFFSFQSDESEISGASPWVPASPRQCLRVGCSPRWSSFCTSLRRNYLSEPIILNNWCYQTKFLLDIIHMLFIYHFAYSWIWRCWYCL